MHPANNSPWFLMSQIWCFPWNHVFHVMTVQWNCTSPDFASNSWQQAEHVYSREYIWKHVLLERYQLWTSMTRANWFRNIKKASSYIAQYPVLRTTQNAFTLYFPDRPVHSDTISASLGSIQPYTAINARRLLIHTSTTVYSQAFIFIQLSELKQCRVKSSTYRMRVNISPQWSVDVDRKRNKKVKNEGRG